MVGPMLAATCMAASPGARGAAPLLALLRQQLFGPGMHAHACMGASALHACPTPAPASMLRLSTSAAVSAEGGAAPGVETKEAAASPPAEAATPAGTDVAGPVLAHRPPQESSSGYFETVESLHGTAGSAHRPHNEQLQLSDGPGLQLTAAEEKVIKNLVGCLTKDGKKSTAERIFLDALSIMRVEMERGAAEAAEARAAAEAKAKAAATAATATQSRKREKV